MRLFFILFFYKKDENENSSDEKPKEFGRTRKSSLGFQFRKSSDTTFNFDRKTSFT